MRTIEQHRDEILALLASPTVAAVPVGDGLGLVLAADVVAATDLPGFDNSAMDGYAVRSVELAGASAAEPVELPVAGDIAAGDTREHVLAPGQSMRIMTGAPIPAGADAVVPIEATDGGVHTVRLSVQPAVGQHIRRRGTDVTTGSTVLTAGTRIGPGHLALAAAANVATLDVRPRPRVSVFSTGDELVPAGSELAHGQIVDSNGLMLAALVRAAGAELVSVDRLPDDADAIGALLRDLPGQPDLVLTTGGVSMGVYDTVKAVLADAGVTFTKVAMRPGMPQGAGQIGPAKTPIITLPGNPVSSLVSFHVFVAPALRALAGLDPLDDNGFDAVAAHGWRSVAGKVEFARVQVVDGQISISGGQGSHQLGAMSEATALAVVPPATAEVQAGQSLRCLPLLGTMGP